MRRVTKNQKGIALFLVLWVLALLSVIVGEFCFAMRTEVNMTRNFKEQTEAYYIALAGLNRAIGELIRNEVVRQKTAKKPESKMEENEEDSESQWRMNVDIAPVPFGQGKFEVKIGNESGKININGANESLLKMMLNAFDIEEQQKSVIIASIMDWRDKNDLHRLNGAEDSYYGSLPEPYECKNGDFDSVEELLMVRGVTPEIFYGGLKDVVTVFKPPERRKKLSGGYRVIAPNFDKININAASKKMLLALPSMTDKLTQAIMDYRKESDFKSLTEVSSLIGPDVYNAILPYISLETSPFYTITSVGKVEGSKILQGVKALIVIDRKLKKGYRLVQWRDGIQYWEEQAPTSEKE
ncbi:MAG: general secretion pathway protein GspK [Desulfobacteraceae bacterium]|nr:general secretion pathway protein GspK [Desulfobacteraceae bacterium]